jgi:geranylgeranyl pyrophosphate synthase
MGYADILRPIQADLERVEERLDELVVDEYGPLPQILQGLFKSGGKRLRPALLLLASKFHPAQANGVIDLAVAVELVHTASLIHDDLVDSSTLRRGVPTLHTSWRREVILLIGDYLFAQAARLVVGATDPRILSSFAESALALSRGELREAMDSERWSATREEYYQRIERKTAALFASCTEIGALVSGAAAEEVGALREYGRQLGMAFQIVDDILDFSGDPRELGKPIGSDLRQGTVTLPVFYYLDANPHLGSLAHILGDGNGRPERVEALVASIRASSAIRAASAEAQEFTRRAKEALVLLPLNAYRQALADLADHLADRRN